MPGKDVILKYLLLLHLLARTIILNRFQLSMQELIQCLAKDKVPLVTPKKDSFIHSN